MKENKRLILAYYLRCLQLTNAGEGIQAISLSEDEETATLVFKTGTNRMFVSRATPGSR